MTPAPDILALDALLGLLLPFWQFVIGALALFTVLASVQRLARRGTSRMTTAMVVTVGALVGFAILGILLESRM